MTTRIPIRTVYDDQNDPVGLAEFQVGEYLGVDYGGTGSNTIAGAKATLGVDASNIRSLFSATGGAEYDNTTGIINVSATDLTPYAKTVDLTTANVAELTNLYFTNARVYANVVELNYATTTYVSNEIANLVSSAPATLDTLNELAAALGDDPNFATSTATLIGSAFNAANTKVATVAGVSATAISNTNLLDGIKAVDGSGSGLDADTLDGENGSYYLDWTNVTNKPDPVITVSLTGDITGSAAGTLIDLASNTISIATTIAANSVALGTDTTGNYVGTITAGTGISSTGATSGEGIAHTLSLATSGVTASTYGGSTSIPVLTVDTYGRITSAANTSITTGTTITNDTSTNSTHYLPFTTATSGSISSAKVSSTKLTFNPSSGLLTSTDYNSSSDKRFKKEIKTVENAVDKVNQLRGVTFKWKEGESQAIGLIAQEVQKVLPEVVCVDESGYLGVRYTNIIGVLVEAIKEQQDQINTLKQQIEKLNG